MIKPTSHLAVGTGILALGIGMGWWLRTQWEIPQGQQMITLPSAGPAVTADSIAGSLAGKSGQNTSGNTMAGSLSNTTALPRETAMTLLREMLKEGDFGGGPPPDFFNFLQALSGCDSATLKAMLAEIQTMEKDPNNEGLHSHAGEFSMMILARLGNIDPSEAINLMIEMKTNGNRLQREMLPFIFSSIAKTNPEQAQSIIDRMPDAESKLAAQEAWMLVRSRQDPDLALQEYLAFPKAEGDDNGNRNAQITRELIKAVALRSPEKGIKAALEIEGEQKQILINEILQGWGQRNPQQLADWALKEKDPTGLRIALEKNVPSVDADQLRRDFATLGPDSTAKEGLANSLGVHYAQQDVSAAVEWSKSLSGANQLNAQNGIASIWIGRDPIAASEWLATWPAGNIKDEAVGRLVDKIYVEDPESALTWAASMEGPNRLYTMARVLQNLQIKDPIAAANVLTDMSEEDRRKIQQSLNGR